jgi:hypothetical protein
MEDAFWAFVDQKWKDSLNVAAAEIAEWDQGADYHKGVEATRKGEQGKQAAKKSPPAGVHVARVDSSQAASSRTPKSASSQNWQDAMAPTLRGCARPLEIRHLRRGARSLRTTCCVRSAYCTTQTHGKAQTTSSSRSITRQRSFCCNVFDPSSAINERESTSWHPWNSHSHGEGCGAYGTLGAAMTLQSQPPRHSKAGAPLPAAVRETTKGVVTPAPKVDPLPAQIFTHFKTLAMACVNFTITMPIGLTGAFHPVLGRKTNSPPNLFRFGGFSHTSHCHSYALSCKRWLDLFDRRSDQ